MILTWAQKCHSALKCLAYMIIGTKQKNNEASHVLLHYSWTLQKTPLMHKCGVPLFSIPATIYN
jgi:hypothetical protein